MTKCARPSTCKIHGPSVDEDARPSGAAVVKSTAERDGGCNFCPNRGIVYVVSGDGHLTVRFCTRCWKQLKR